MEVRVSAPPLELSQIERVPYSPSEHSHSYAEVFPNRRHFHSPPLSRNDFIKQSLTINSAGKSLVSKESVNKHTPNHMDSTITGHKAMFQSLIPGKRRFSDVDALNLGTKKEIKFHILPRGKCYRFQLPPGAKPGQQINVICPGRKSFAAILPKSFLVGTKTIIVVEPGFKLWLEKRRILKNLCAATKIDQIGMKETPGKESQDNIESKQLTRRYSYSNNINHSGSQDQFERAQNLGKCFNGTNVGLQYQFEGFHKYQSKEFTRKHAYSNNTTQASEQYQFGGVQNPEYWEETNVQDKNQSSLGQYYQSVGVQNPEYREETVRNEVENDKWGDSPWNLVNNLDLVAASLNTQETDNKDTPKHIDSTTTSYNTIPLNSTLGKISPVKTEKNREQFLSSVTKKESQDTLNNCSTGNSPATIKIIPPMPEHLPSSVVRKGNQDTTNELTFNHTDNSIVLSKRTSPRMTGKIPINVKKKKSQVSSAVTSKSAAKEKKQEIENKKTPNQKETTNELTFNHTDNSIVISKRTSPRMAGKVPINVTKKKSQVSSAVTPKSAAKEKKQKIANKKTSNQTNNNAATSKIISRSLTEIKIPINVTKKKPRIYDDVASSAVAEIEKQEFENKNISNQIDDNTTKSKSISPCLLPRKNSFDGTKNKLESPQGMKTRSGGVKTRSTLKKEKLEAIKTNTLNPADNSTVISKCISPSLIPGKGSICIKKKPEISDAVMLRTGRRKENQDTAANKHHFNNTNNITAKRKNISPSSTPGNRANNGKKKKYEVSDTAATISLVVKAKKQEDKNKKIFHRKVDKNKVIPPMTPGKSMTSSTKKKPKVTNAASSSSVGKKENQEIVNKHKSNHIVTKKPTRIRIPTSAMVKELEISSADMSISVAKKENLEAPKKNVLNQITISQTICPNLTTGNTVINVKRKKSTGETSDVGPIRENSLHILLKKKCCRVQLPPDAKPGQRIKVLWPDGKSYAAILPNTLLKGTKTIMVVEPGSGLLLEKSGIGKLRKGKAKPPPIEHAYSNKFTKVGEQYQAITFPNPGDWGKHTMIEKEGYQQIWDHDLSQRAVANLDAFLDELSFSNKHVGMAALHSSNYVVKEARSKVPQIPLNDPMIHASFHSSILLNGKNFYAIAAELNHNVKTCLNYYYGTYKASPEYKILKEQCLCDQDACCVCRKPGEVLCCNNCPKLFHLECINPPLEKVPAGDWFCSLCKDYTIVEQEDEHEIKSTKKEKM